MTPRAEVVFDSRSRYYEAVIDGEIQYQFPHAVSFIKYPRERPFSLSFASAKGMADRARDGVPVPVVSGTSGIRYHSHSGGENPPRQVRRYGEVRSQWYTILSVEGSMVRPVPGCEKILSRTEAEERLGFLRDTNPSLRVFLSLVSQTSEYECTLVEGA